MWYLLLFVRPIISGLVHVTAIISKRRFKDFTYFLSQKYFIIVKSKYFSLSDKQNFAAYLLVSMDFLLFEGVCRKGINNTEFIEDILEKHLALRSGVDSWYVIIAFAGISISSKLELHKRVNFSWFDVLWNIRVSKTRSISDGGTYEIHDLLKSCKETIPSLAEASYYVIWASIYFCFMRSISDL